MNKNITAKIPARKVGKNEYRAFEVSYEQDADGRWIGGLFGEAVIEEDVIAMCKMASNWKEIRAEHFPMNGFHE